MVPSIARQSVVIKCNQQTSVLLGNYEFYYLAGLMKKLYDLELNEDMQPFDMLNEVQSKLDELAPSTPQEEYLIKKHQNIEVTKAIECFYRSAEEKREINVRELV